MLLEPRAIPQVCQVLLICLQLFSAHLAAHAQNDGDNELLRQQLLEVYSEIKDVTVEYEIETFSTDYALLGKGSVSPSEVKVNPKTQDVWLPILSELDSNGFRGANTAPIQAKWMSADVRARYRYTSPLITGGSQSLDVTFDGDTTFSKSELTGFSESEKNLPPVTGIISPERKQTLLLGLGISSMFSFPNAQSWDTLKTMIEKNEFSVVDGPQDVDGVKVHTIKLNGVPEAGQVVTLSLAPDYGMLPVKSTVAHSNGQIICEYEVEEFTKFNDKWFSRVAREVFLETGAVLLLPGSSGVS